LCFARCIVSRYSTHTSIQRCAPLSTSLGTISAFHAEITRCPCNCFMGVPVLVGKGHCGLMYYPSRYNFCISCRNHSMSLQLFSGCGRSGLQRASSDLPTQETNCTEMRCHVCGCSNLQRASSDLATQETNCTEMRCHGCDCSGLYRELWLDIAPISVLFLHCMQKSLDVLATVLWVCLFWSTKGIE
jgi:hypothetical protein